MRAATLWRPEGDRIRCLLCPRACLIPCGARGVCGVRQNVNGALFATTYACVSSVGVDPIEKKPVYHYKPGTRVFSLGGLGCTMSCGHCQNWRISHVSRGTADAPVRLIPPDEAVQGALDSGSAGIAFTYNEPIVWIEYVADVAAVARSRGLYTVMVTNGYVTRYGLDYVGGHIDVWRVDIKGFTEKTYRALCGSGTSPGSIFDAAIRAKHEWGMHVEVVTNIVPGLNDSDDEARAIARFVARSIGEETPWHVTRFVPCLDLSDAEPTPFETLARAARIGREERLAYVYIGNVVEPGVADTVCPRCAARAIVREGHTVIKRATSGGACAACGYTLHIIE